MTSTETGGPVVRGCCHVYYALDIGFSVDLKRCAGLIQEAHERVRLPPSHADAGLLESPARAGSHQPGHGADSRPEFSHGELGHDHDLRFRRRVRGIPRPFRGDPRSHRRAQQRVVRQNAVRGRCPREGRVSAGSHPPCGAKGERPRGDGGLPRLRDPSLGAGGRDFEAFLSDNRQVLAQVLSSNTNALSRQQLREELSRCVAYYEDDLTIITWNAALVFGANMEDVLTVLELANVQLRELHCLDDQLDDSLQESYDIREQAKSVKASMRHIRELMLDGQAFSEAVTNAFKPFPDAFLARVYDLASRAMGLQHFDRSIKDKLSLLNTLYTTLSDEAAHERSVRLEWIVIILIVIEIIMGFSEKLLPLFHHAAQ